MSPVCLINVAEIRDQTRPSPELRHIMWHARFANWLARLLHIGRR